MDQVLAADAEAGRAIEQLQLDAADLALDVAEDGAVFVARDRGQVPDGGEEGLLAGVPRLGALAFADAEEPPRRRAGHGEVVERLDLPQPGLVDDPVADEELGPESLDLLARQAGLLHQPRQRRADFFFPLGPTGRGAAGGVGGRGFLLLLLLAGPVGEPGNPLGDLGRQVVDRLALGGFLADHEARLVVAPVEEFLPRRRVRQPGDEVRDVVLDLVGRLEPLRRVVVRLRRADRFVEDGVVVREIGGVLDRPWVVRPESGLCGQVVRRDGAFAREDGAHLGGGVVLPELRELGGGVGFEVCSGDFVGVRRWSWSGDGGLRGGRLDGSAYVYACDRGGAGRWTWRSFIVGATSSSSMKEAALTGAADVWFGWSSRSSTNQGRALHRGDLMMK